MYSYINKYNKNIYILLGIYIILVFIFSLLLNGFFVKPKAFSNNYSFEVSGEVVGNNQTRNDVKRFSYDGISHQIVYVDEEFTELLKNKVSVNNSTDLYPTCVRIGARGYGTGSESEELISTSGDINAPSAFSYSTFYDFGPDINTDIYNYFVNKGVTFGKPNNKYLWVAFYTDGQHDNSPGYTYSYSFEGDVQYVDNPNDLYDYIINLNNDVVNNGDPYNPELNVDSQIPTPQKVAVYKESSSPTLVWSNPKGISNNENIKVHIEWKPVITLTHGLYDVHSLIEQDYEMLYFGDIGEYNSFCTLNNNGSPPPNVLNSYNTIYDSKVLFSGTGAQQSNDWANYFILKNNVDWVTRVDPFGTNDLFGKGTYSGVRVPDLKYRIRYETETGVSDWIYSDREFDSDNVSGPSQHSSTHSRNASGEPVSNPTYTPNNDNKIIPQNEVDDLEDSDKKKSNSIFDFISGFFDTIISAITAIFDKLKEIVDSISNGTGSFFSFFADLFGAFPQLLGIFLLGLVVTVLLRVLGR